MNELVVIGSISLLAGICSGGALTVLKMPEPKRSGISIFFSIFIFCLTYGIAELL